MSHEEYMLENINKLFKSRLEYINSLSRLQEDIRGLMDAGPGNNDEIVSKKNGYDKLWSEFVGVHEQYLEVVAAEDERRRANLTYKEQMDKKIYLYKVVACWQRKSKLRSIGKGQSQVSVSRSAASSASALSKKREKVALAQLKVNQLKQRHEMQRKMAELKYEEELMEAQMEEEQAKVSFNIQNELANEYIQGRSEFDALPENSVYELDSEFHTVLTSIQDLSRTTQNVGKHEAYKPVGCVAGRMDCDYAMLTMVNRPVVNYPTLIHKVQEQTSQLCASIPQTSKSWIYLANDRLQLNTKLPSAQQMPPVENCRNLDKLDADVWHPTARLPVESAAKLPWQPPERKVELPMPTRRDSGEEMVRALRQVVSTPRIKYMSFDGDPMNYVSFIHNFETCLKKDNPDNATRLQLLIQHCNGKAREAIESCVNLPVEQGYVTAKNTLKENFGKPHIIAKAHIKKLENLPVLKQADGPSLLEYARKLEIANRTLTSMGPEYESELSHVNTLRELNRKLPMFMKVKWTERAGTIIESGSRPKFQDFLEFVQGRARLVNNEFAEDLASNMSKIKGKGQGVGGRFVQRATTLTAGAQRTQEGNRESNSPYPKCSFCSGAHRIWKCLAYNKISYQDKKKFVQENHLCMKCLSKGHFMRTCPKVHFRCQKEGCSKEHHTLLHPPEAIIPQGNRDLPDEHSKGKGSDNEKNKHAESRVTVATGAGERVCLSVVPVKVQIKGREQPSVVTYALLDCGSEVTLIHQKLQKKLEAHGQRIDFFLTGINGSKRIDSELLDILDTSMDGVTSLELSNVRTVEQMPIAGSCIARREDIQRWPHLDGVPITELGADEVTLVIGLQEKPSIFLPIEYRIGGENDPVAIKYSLGWTIVGPLGERRKNDCYTMNFARTVSDVKSPLTNLEPQEKQCKVNELEQPVEEDYQLENSLDEGVSMLHTNWPACELKSCLVEERSMEQDLNHKLERLWRTDFEDCVVDTNVCQSIEDKRALIVMEESIQQVDNHYQVALPWRHKPPYLPNNKEMALRRGLMLKKRLLRDESLLEKYAAAMNDYLEKGYAEKIPQEQLQPSNKPIWYLPHHPVSHPAKPEKVRVVYDCAATYKNTSLNQQLLQGPDQTNQLVGVLIRFRQEKVGLVSDIEAMFHQVLVEPQDCDALRFLWWPNADLTGEMEEYRMVRHLFGATSSPSVANFCLRRTADDHESEFDQSVVDAVKRNMYVDDMMRSVKQPDEAVTLVKESRRLLAKGGFRLTKWYSNNREVLASIPESERAKSVADLDVEKLPIESALGLKWNTEDDTFIWDVTEKLPRFLNTEPVTRRALVSAVYSLFDPLGFLAPYVMKAKLLLQMLCRKGIGWDDPLGEDECAQWKRWLEDLLKLREIRVKRCFKPAEFADLMEIQLHLFSDASRVGYSAVAFLRLTDSNNQIYCAFVMGKARLAPIREISIPRLELTAAVISVKLSKIIRDELDLEIGRIFYWTDSTSVLKCINNETKRFHTFESNRLTIIHNGSEVNEWRYVNRGDNPADDGSKGLKLDNLIKNNRWLQGPEFLWKNEDHWPKREEIPIMKEDDPEVRKEARIYTAATSVHPVERLILYFSSWWKLKRVVAWLLRFKERLRMKLQLQKMAAKDIEAHLNKEESLPTQLTLNELHAAEKEILQQVQTVEFPEELKTISVQDNRKESRKSLKKKGSALSQLNPFVEEGLLRVGGRLSDACIDNNLKHPIILPSKHPVTELIIRQHHAEVGHMGQESVLSSIRKQYWILKGRAAVKRVIKSCVICQRRKARLSEQFMANLPETRLTPNKPPFTYVGVDYFGPLQVKQKRSTVKRYGCIFTCFTTRAVHIEIAHSLDTDSMLNALRRFISIRGCPEQIRSDRGTNFVSANKKLMECMEQWNEERIGMFCLQRNIQWIFNPPSASHMGGVWERMIRSVRQILRAVLKEQLVTDEVLLTVMAEAMNILNSRPLTRNSDSPSDLEPLTPNHLLHLRPSPSLPPGVFRKEDSYSNRAWRQAQYLSNLFWRRWTKEYLPTLMERRKWNSPKENLKVGDVVLLADEAYPRGRWPLAVVVEAESSRDGYVRTVKVRTSSTVATRAKRNKKGKHKTSTTILTRPVTKLCVLEMDGEVIPDETSKVV